VSIGVLGLAVMPILSASIADAEARPPQLRILPKRRESKEHKNCKENGGKK
jgi:hypothetical protein